MGWLHACMLDAAKDPAAKDPTNIISTFHFHVSRARTKMMVVRGGWHGQLAMKIREEERLN